MPYKVKGKIKGNVASLTDSDERKWDAFLAHLDRMDPEDAARAATGSASGLQYKQTGSQIQFRLSGKNRVSFVLNKAGKELSQVQVGGHS